MGSTHDCWKAPAGGVNGKVRQAGGRVLWGCVCIKQAFNFVAHAVDPCLTSKTSSCLPKSAPYWAHTWQLGSQV